LCVLLCFVVFLVFLVFLVFWVFLNVFHVSVMWWFVCCLMCGGLCLVLCSNTQTTIHTIGQQLFCLSFSLRAMGFVLIASRSLRSLAAGSAQRMKHTDRGSGIAHSSLRQRSATPCQPWPAPWPRLPSSSSPWQSWVLANQSSRSWPL
jgi:hypothetical protein